MTLKLIVFPPTPSPSVQGLEPRACNLSMCFLTSIALLGVPLNCDHSIDFFIQIYFHIGHTSMQFIGVGEHLYWFYVIFHSNLFWKYGVAHNAIIIANYWSFHHVVNQLSICARPRAAGVQLINVFIQSSPSPFHVLTSITLNNVTIQLIFWFKYVSTEVTLTSLSINNAHCHSPSTRATRGAFIYLLPSSAPHSGANLQKFVTKVRRWWCQE